MGFAPLFIVLLLYFTGIPIAYALFGATMVYFGFMNTGSPAYLILQKFITSAQSFSLLAIPFFVMAGSIMNYAGISNKLMAFADVLTGHMPGALAQVNVLLSMLMGGVSGSANADAAMEAKMLVPEMERRGYDRGFSAAITAASSAVTPVIPPGINLIIYALIANVSVGKMFMAGYIPGIFMALCLMVVVHFISKKRGYMPTRDKIASPLEMGKQALDSIWAIFFPIGIIGGMRIGIFTPSECGAIAVLYCIVVGAFVYRELKPAHIAPILQETVEGTAGVVLIIVAANVFGQYMTWQGIPGMISKALLGVTTNKYAMLLIINAILLVVGMFMEGGAAMIILAPLLIPVVRTMGVDLVHFGLIIIVNIMIGGLTPPFGSMMFTVCSIIDCPIPDFVKEALPFIAALIVALLIVTYFPPLTLLIPNLVFGA
ncbi:TRAP transporter large permease [[Clostridium] aminophilum]|uniref:TRAP transporter large permease n=1 Tax=[Clostridium] aminophilum TaxID=1526 RepID=UPI00331C51D5